MSKIAQWALVGLVATLVATQTPYKATWEKIRPAPSAFEQRAQLGLMPEPTEVWVWSRYGHGLYNRITGASVQFIPGPHMVEQLIADDPLGLQPN